MSRAALLSAAYALFHVPDLVRYGSKPVREIGRNPGRLEEIEGHLRSYEEAVAYPPHQVFVGNLEPDALRTIERPWYRQPLEMAFEDGPFGRIAGQDAFYRALIDADDFKLVHQGDDLPANGLPLWNRGRIAGWVEPGHPEDDSQAALVMLENLAAKATAVEAARLCLQGFDTASVDYVMNTGEEGIGDRYQRGGGNLAKAVAEDCGCSAATGADIKAFCCAPAHAMVIAAALIESGLYRHVLVVGGGSMPKLGMKFEGHLRHGMPVLEDVLASMAFLLGPEDGQSPVINLSSVGRHPVSAGATPQAIYGALISEPLARLGLRFDDVDKYAVELHDPDVTEPAGSGDVPSINYRAIAALAVINGQMQAGDIPKFVRRHGMPGFAPTQGHIPSGVPYLAHARREMMRGAMRRAMVVAKGSLFLGKMTQLADGMSFLLEAS
ncbi:MAG: glycine reductase [Chloroflexota bacterium]|nr:glycine reductase [Chloroflexota bacterium]